MPGTITMEQLAAIGGAELEADQAAIDGREAWKLEGSIGRALMDAIRAGHCRLGHLPARDYYGNQIPAWWMVEPGTLGSLEYCERQAGACRFEPPFTRAEAEEAWDENKDSPELFEQWVDARIKEEA